MTIGEDSVADGEDGRTQTEYEGKQILGGVGILQRRKKRDARRSRLLKVTREKYGLFFLLRVPVKIDGADNFQLTRYFMLRLTLTTSCFLPLHEARRDGGFYRKKIGVAPVCIDQHTV